MPPSLTRGPLPAKVYWRRRFVLLGGALALVLALGRVLGGGSDGSSDDPGTAQQVAGQPTSSAASKSPWVRKKPRNSQPIVPPTSRAPELAVPDGPCVDSDIAVTPSVVGEAVAGRDVTFQLDVRTIVDEACTWRVSPAHLTVAITSGADDIWSSQQCPATIPVQDLVVRRDVTASLSLVWAETKRSDEDCSRLTGWAMPGYYHVAAASLGGEPSDLQFELVRPQPDVVVESTPPGNGGKGGKGGKGAGNGAASGTGGGTGNGGSQSGGGKPNRPDDDATDGPSGAVEPNG